MLLGIVVSIIQGVFAILYLLLFKKILLELYFLVMFKNVLFLQVAAVSVHVSFIVKR